jgi:hypothetical protein
MGAFSQDNSIEEAAFARQNGRCGFCGKSLSFEKYEVGDWGAWAAHHIDGDPNNNRLSNCVCLCVNQPENCHLNIGHHGDFNGPYVASRSDYRYLNG